MSNSLIGIKPISEAEIIECPDEIVSGNMKIKIKEGSNPWWAAYQVLNTKNPINGMSMSVDGGASWTEMVGPELPAPSGFWFMKPDGLILNADNGLENYKIRVESDTGDIIVDMVGVVDGGETDAGTNNAGGDDCGGPAPPPSPTPSPAPSPAPTPSPSSCSGTLCGVATTEPITDEIKTLRDMTSCTLDNDLVEAISPGSSSNPQNVKNVETVFPESKFNDFFPTRNAAYTYTNFLKAIGKYPSICSSASLCPKILANMFAHFQQETAGLFYLEEINKSPYCSTTAWVTAAYPCVSGQMYYGRGAKQLSWNYNYGAFSRAMYGDAMILLNNPDLVATTWLNFAATMWFFVSPQPPKPSMLQVLDGSWTPNANDLSANLQPGFGVTTMIINGALECGFSSQQAQNRATYYADFAQKMSVDITGEKLNCNDMQQFSSSGSAGSIKLYWAPESGCSLVSWQTAYNALVEGDHSRCKGLTPSCSSSPSPSPAPTPAPVPSPAPGPAPSPSPSPSPSTCSEERYDYTEVLRLSNLFYEAQRSGKLPADNRIPWRGDSSLGDQGNNGEDLTGGYHDGK